MQWKVGNSFLSGFGSCLCKISIPAAECARTPNLRQPRLAGNVSCRALHEGVRVIQEHRSMEAVATNLHSQPLIGESPSLGND